MTADSEKTILASKLLRQPMIVAIGLSLGIYIVLVLVYFLTGRPTKFSNLLEWLSWSMIIIPAISASILGQRKIRHQYTSLPTLTFLVLFYWLITILALLKAPLSHPTMDSFRYLLSESKFTYLITSTTLVALFIPAVFIWSLTIKRIVLTPLLNLKESSITDSITGTTKRSKLGCLMVFIIGIFLYMALGLSVTAAALVVVPVTLLLELLLALIATSLYKIEERKFYILLAIWFIPTLTMLIELVFVSQFVF